MAVKGAILGDILGSPYEFKRVREYDWKTVPLTGNPPAKFTDDTVMTLAIKKAIIEGLDITETMVEVGRRYPNCGYGGSFYKWVNGDDHTPYGSYGNGSAMRCFYESTDYESFMRNVISLNCDTDTFGAIAGGVAEEFYHGFGDLDAERILEKCLDEYMLEILKKIYDDFFGSSKVMVGIDHTSFGEPLFYVVTCRYMKQYNAYLSGFGLSHSAPQILHPVCG